MKQKLMNDYQNHLTEVKITKGHFTKFQYDIVRYTTLIVHVGKCDLDPSMCTTMLSQRVIQHVTMHSTQYTIKMNFTIYIQ